MTFVVKQEHFEGPLDLLLSLIEKRKLFVNDIALAKVTDDYINHIKNLNEFPMSDSVNFILIASTLLLIKSKSLLPQLSLTEEEEEGIHDLETRLKIYQAIKDASVHVSKKFGENIIFFPSKSRPQVTVFSPHESMTVPNLFESIKRILAQIPKNETVPQAVIKKVISLEEMIDSLTVRVSSSLKMSFKEFSKIGKEEKVNVIVSFLAMLELVKQGIIHVSQEGAFDDIHMETKQVGVPNYQ